MSRVPDQSESQLDLPEALRDELARAYCMEMPVPAAVDSAILQSAKHGVARRRDYRRLLRWAGAGAAAAAAAVVVLAVMLRDAAETPGPVARGTASSAVITGDVDQSGRVDILDALVLAKKVEINAKSAAPSEKLPVLKWEDVNLDGIVNDTDVDRIAAAAVDVTGGTVQ